MVPERNLLVLSEEPLNAETKLGERTGTITPAGSHYVRTHFPLPHAPREIAVDGAVERPMSITFDEVRALPARTLAVTLECAGNGRRYLDPKVPGEQWGLGAVGTAEWTGTPLGALLIDEGLLTDAQLDAALAEQSRSGKPLGRLLIEAGTISEAELVRTLARQVGLEFVDLNEVTIDGSVAALVTESLARRYQAIPVAWEDGHRVSLHDASRLPHPASRLFSYAPIRSSTRKVRPISSRPWSSISRR